jgi:hypothetical protein
VEGPSAGGMRAHRSLSSSSARNNVTKTICGLGAILGGRLAGVFRFEAKGFSFFCEVAFLVYATWEVWLVCATRPTSF